MSEDTSNIEDIAPLPKVDLKKYPAPDISERKAVWNPEEKAWFYFKKDATDEYIETRLNSYKFRKKW